MNNTSKFCQGLLIHLNDNFSNSVASHQLAVAGFELLQRDGLDVEVQCLNFLHLTE